MKKYFFLLSIFYFFFFSSCTRKKIFNYNLLEGDWVFVSQKTTNINDSTAPCDPTAPKGWSFPLSLRNKKGDLYDSIYKVINDTVFFKKIPRPDEKIENVWYPRFVIKSITKDTLVLSSLKDSLDYTLFNSDIIKDPSIHVNRICFSSSGCFGTCPCLNIELNKDGPVYFQGRTFAQKKGNFTGKISPQTFSYFEELIQKIGLEKLDSVNEVDVTDSQAIGLKVFYNNGKIKNIYVYPVFEFDSPFFNQLDYDLMRFDSYFPLIKSDKTYPFIYNKFPRGFQIPLEEMTTVKFTPPSE
jgi:hypothetical protein